MYESKTEQDQANFSSCFDTIWNLKKWKYTYPESITDWIVLSSLITKQIAKHVGVHNGFVDRCFETRIAKLSWLLAFIRG